VYKPEARLFCLDIISLFTDVGIDYNNINNYSDGIHQERIMIMKRRREREGARSAHAND
jgi:hypothetical protein